MGEFERGLITVMALCGVLILLGYKRAGTTRQTERVKSEPPR